MQKGNFYEPDFYPQMDGMDWVDMGDPQQVDISPAVGAFKQRFMQKPPATAPNMGIHEMGHAMPDAAVPDVMPDMAKRTGGKSL